MVPYGKWRNTFGAERIRVPGGSESDHTEDEFRETEPLAAAGARSPSGVASGA
jgi:hypothetical protein